MFAAPKHLGKSPITSHRTSKFSGNVTVAGDKSISHRSLMLSSQVLGRTYITGLLEGEDVLATAEALKKLGVTVTRHKKGEWSVEGVGIGGLSEPEDVLDMGNAGTGARLMMGLLSSYNFTSTFTGDASLCSRPMERVITPLKEVGATFMSRSKGRMPLSMRGATTSVAINHKLKVASAQVKSAILLAGLNSAGVTTVIENKQTRDHTENILNYFGIKVESEIKENGEKHISLLGQQQTVFADRTINVPADPSSAAFLVVAALLIEGSNLTITNVGMNKHRTGLFTTLQEMGADITYSNERSEGGEPVADMTIKHSQLNGIEIPASRAPSMIDEYPILAIAAATAKGTTIMNGLEELRVKESDRLQAIIDGLAECGVKTSLDDDNLSVFGVDGQIEGGASIQTNLDHRIAMSFLVMGMVSQKPVLIDDKSAIATSFPNFAELMNSLGADMRDGNNLSISKARTAVLPSDLAKSPQAAPPLLIAIDGPAASGKGTLARRLASYYGYGYLDTGSLYRAVGLRIHYDNKSPDDKNAAIEAAKSINESDLRNPRLRQENIGHAASVISAYPEVREILLDYQRNYANRENGAVLDGRDIGTVVCPDANIKLFVTAGVEARAGRRHRELQGQGIEVVYDSVLEDLRERDQRDMKRDAAPLKAADNAHTIDTTNLKAQEVFDMVVKYVSKY